jgi:hypothetical protein
VHQADFNAVLTELLRMKQTALGKFEITAPCDGAIEAPAGPVLAQYR